MRNKFLSLVVLASISSTALAASDNVITFQGEVTDETCALTVNGENASPIVLLPTVTASDLDASGKVAGETSFEIGVSGCTGNAAGVTISTVFVGNQVTTEGNLGNTGTAGNVDIQVLAKDSTVINFANGFKGTGDLKLGANETSATATYKAQYYATGKATVGTVQATLQYAVSYQ